MLTLEPKRTQNRYEGVTTRFLREDERLISSSETEMPLVFEAKERKDITFLKSFLENNSEEITNDIGKYGAVLFRGFAIQSDKDFEDAVISIKNLHGISDAFMSEHGRERVGDLKYVLYTNTIYKTGGTLYFGGFHSENYYSPDVPGYISFCCLKPSTVGGETGLVNLEKVYEELNDELKTRLEDSPYFVGKWLVSDVAKRYEVDTETVEEICRRFDLPIEGEGEDKLILMYKPSVFVNPVTKKKALAINFFSLPTLDNSLRKFFLDDYQGSTWFWHRFVWKLPPSLFKGIENISIFSIAFFHSPKEVMEITESNRKTERALKKLGQKFTKINSAFKETDIEELARLMRKFYSSTLWKKGDILIVDNRKVAHTGMPGSGPRIVRALIANPLEMKYSSAQSGCYTCQDRTTESIGYYMEQARKKAAAAKS